MTMEKTIQTSLGQVVMRSLEFQDEFTALEMTAKHRKATTGKADFHPYTKQLCLTLLSIKTAPFELTIEALGKIPRQDGLALSRGYDELNAVSLGESQPSEDTSSEEK